MRSSGIVAVSASSSYVLVIALRRVMHRQIPLNDEIYSKQVAIDHVHSCVAWVRSDGLIGSVNPALAKTVRMLPRELVGQHWEILFPENGVGHATRSLPAGVTDGKTTLVTQAQRPDGTLAQVQVAAGDDSRSQVAAGGTLLPDGRQDARTGIGTANSETYRGFNGCAAHPLTPTAAIRQSPEQAASRLRPGSGKAARA